MTDEIAPIETTPAASPTPVEAAPSPEVVEATPAAVEQIAPVAPVPAEASTEAPAEAAKPETLLGSEKKTEETKPQEKTEAETTPEVKAEDTISELPVYEPFVLPEGVTLEADKLGEFTKTLAEFETTTKASHEEMQKLGQQLVDRHIQELQRYTESLTHAWNKQKNDWKDSFLKAPEFANRTDTVVNSAIDAIGVYGGDAKQQEEFRSLMESTGVGNHPAMIRLLSNIMLAKAEPKQLAAPQIASGATVSKVQKMYGAKKA